jgi:cytochrome oxidase Cu insertion factor (SCO1/SenC/PrrC family)
MHLVSSAIDDPAQPSGSRTDVPARETGRPSPGNRAAIVLATALAVVAGLGLLAVKSRLDAPPEPAAVASSSDSTPRATGLPPAVPTSVATLMGLSPVPVKAAPSFTLVDQHGTTMSLAAFKGHPVVLEFMDPNCVDICPIVSQEFIDAYRDLGSAGPGVVFLGVNVNAYHSDVASVKAYSDAHDLSSVSSWHFLTGGASTLESVWHDYGVTVSAPSPTADVIHTSVLYFIDAAGQERYVAFPMADHAADGSSYLPAGPTASWGKGIALVAESLR